MAQCNSQGRLALGDRNGRPLASPKWRRVGSYVMPCISCPSEARAQPNGSEKQCHHLSPIATNGGERAKYGGEASRRCRLACPTRLPNQAPPAARSWLKLNGAGGAASRVNARIINMVETNGVVQLVRKIDEHVPVEARRRAKCAAAHLHEIGPLALLRPA